MTSLFRKTLSVILWCLLMWPVINAQAGNVMCPDSAAALNPAPLEEEWAVEWWMPRHEEKHTEENRESSEILFIGDSITHGWETEGSEIFREYYSDYHIHNLGFSGDRTENVLWRIENGALDKLDPKVAVMMIGTNNTGHRQDSPECTAKGIEMILNELNDRLPDTHVLLLAIFPRSESPDDELRELNEDINNRIREFDSRENVTFENINKIFLTEDGVLAEEIMPDHLHPNEYGYELWAEEMLPMMKRLLEM